MQDTTAVAAGLPPITRCPHCGDPVSALPAALDLLCKHLVASVTAGYLGTLTDPPTALPRDGGPVVTLGLDPDRGEARPVDLEDLTADALRSLGLDVGDVGEHTDRVLRALGTYAERRLPEYTNSKASPHPPGTCGLCDRNRAAATSTADDTPPTS